MRFLVAVALLGFAACATQPSPTAYQTRAGVDVDLTGTDVAKFDSLAKGYAVGPVADTIAMVPIPIPARMRRTSVTAVFTVSERGAVTRISLTPPADVAYGRELVKRFLTFRFRPATKADGTPTIGHYRFSVDF